MIKLTRTDQSDKGTFGVLSIDDVPVCVTLEDPWKGNRIGESCIPPGTYKVSPHTGFKYKNVWILEKVPGRTEILIHSGNSITDTRGCILAGKYFYGAGIAVSRETIQMLRERLPKSFYITIVNCVKP